MISVLDKKVNTRIDWLHVGLLVALFGCVLLVVPPAHSYSVTDDWAYAHSVQDMVRLNYHPSEWSMATSLSHVAWGAIFVSLFGFSFTVLTVSNLIMSLTGIVLFYFLLRQLEVAPEYALLGAAVLFLNPMYIYLSYSYMTDVPFVTYSLAALLCYVKGIRSRGSDRAYLWLAAGSLFVSLAYLARQLGIIQIVAMFIYLVWQRPRRWQIGRILAASLLPCVIIVVYAAWESQFQLTLAAYVQDHLRAAVFTNFRSWLVERSVRLTWGTFLLGLMLLPLLGLRFRKSSPKTLLSVALPFGIIFCLLDVGFKTTGFWVPHNAGNILDSTGFLMQQYGSAPLFNEAFWLVLCLLSALSLSIFIASIAARLVGWRPFSRSPIDPVSERSPQDTVSETNSEAAVNARNGAIRKVATRIRGLTINPPHPRTLIFLWGLITFLVTDVLSYVTTDRYWMPIFPALIVVALTGFGAYKTNSAAAPTVPRSFRLRWAFVAGMAVVALIGQQDYMAHAAARWQAGEQLMAQGVPSSNIYMGIEWSNWYLSDEGFQYFRTHGNTGKSLNPAEAVTDPVYLVSDIPVADYKVVRSWVYQSVLRGGQGLLLVLQRDPITGQGAALDEKR